MNPHPPPESCTLDAVRAAKAEARTVFAQMARVVGVGVTRVGDGYGLKVNLDRSPSAGVSLPVTVRGVPVRVAVVGGVTKQAVRKRPPTPGAP